MLHLFFYQHKIQRTVGLKTKALISCFGLRLFDDDCSEK
ncbi:hypothetical protein P20480_3278 [Pseudoalteromonas sp. BSi20480]|nr:hypothetical protein P20480_3278 [Pseudoalteromonas sp. BSi20480]